MPSIRVPFSLSSSGRINTTSSVEKIVEQQIIDVLTTGKRERVMRPTYGAGANQLLFEPVDALVYSEFKTDAIPEINRNLSTGYVSNLSVKPLEVPIVNENPETSLSITAAYSVRQGTRQTLTFTISNPLALTEESAL